MNHLVKLQRDLTRDQFGRMRREVLAGSTRNRKEDAEELARKEKERTGVVWEVTSA